MPYSSKALIGVATAAIAVASAGSAAQQVNLAERQQQVRVRETAFAKSMADRDLAAFTSFISPEAVFVGVGGTTRGPIEIAAAWKRFFDGPAAPFSWRPETVEILASGALALSSGPVLDPQGQRIGTYNSTWRRDPDGVWRVVFDNGCP
jgi:ketosteroid isomerase-like protein